MSMRKPEEIMIGDRKLSDILDDHVHWLKSTGAKYNKPDVLVKADLRNADLRYACLAYSDLNGADLSGSILSHAYIRGADLRDVNLTGAYLEYSILNFSVLSCANLQAASIKGADLTGADLRWASLSGADLSFSNLTEADLRLAILSGAYVAKADFKNALMNGTEGIEELHLPYTCPDHGKFIGWKKAIVKRGSIVDKVLVELEIPEDAKRLSGTGRKCRCDKAKVLSIRNLQGEPIDEKRANSLYNHDFVYTVGEIIQVANFDENRWIECSTGIHFFIDREEAVNY